MGLRIATNVSSLTSQRHLINTRRLLDRSLERLSSGYRINKAGDDAAGLAISEKLRAKTRGLIQAQRNASDGISLIQVAEGGLEEIQNILVRLRELGVQAASDTIGAQERRYLNEEYQSLKEEVDRIANVTEFNGTVLLDGTGGSLDFQDPRDDTTGKQLVRRAKRHAQFSAEYTVGAQWGTICDDSFSTTAADLICRSDVPDPITR